MRVKDTVRARTLGESNGHFFIHAVFSLAATQMPIRKTTTPIAVAENGTENTDAKTRYKEMQSCFKSSVPDPS
jgi:hypothetical protein